MEVVSLAIPDVLLLEPTVHSDERGFFFESYNEREFAVKTGLACRFVQDNHSHSVRHSLRGLHYQIRRPQGKLVRVLSGEIYDVAVDIRRSSATFGRWLGESMSAQDRRQMWVPEGFAHGFLVLSESADVLYKTTDYYAPEWDRVISWNDPDLAIEWPLEGVEPVLSAKDGTAAPFVRADLFD